MLNFRKYNLEMYSLIAADGNFVDPTAEVSQDQYILGQDDFDFQDPIQVAVEQTEVTFDNLVNTTYGTVMFDVIVDYPDWTTIPELPSDLLVDVIILDGYEGFTEIGYEPLPSGTPFRSLAALTNAARSAFKMIRERIGEKIGYILKEEILPDVIKNWNKGDLLNIVEDDVDIEMFNQSLIARTMRNAILNGKLVDSLALEQIEKAVTSQAEKQGRKLKIPKGYFNFKYGIKFNITGEAYDKAQQNAAYEAAINYMIANPAFINTPLAKQWLENNGISYWKIKPEEIQQLAQGQQAMGGQGGQPQSTEPKKDTLMSSIDTE